MPDRPDARLVYSTGSGRACPRCARPVASCTCGAKAQAAIPARITVKIRLETKGRGGKAVTVLAGLPDDAGFKEELLGSLKRALATGGALADGGVELRGDCRDRLRPLLAARGYTVKG